jgi:hypothetical protein
MAGQTVEVFRPYRRKDKPPEWDISLSDGSRAFLPESWTEATEITPSAGLRELDAYALLNLAKIVTELQERFSQKGAKCDEPACMDSISSGNSTVVDPVAGGSQPETLVQLSGEPR